MQRFELRSVRVLALTCLVFAGGCASFTPSESISPAASAAPRVYHDRLALSGRISAQYQNNGK
ncbi:MAG: hypothetical protein K0S28_872, partial [Paucimonas sp.]|nr:hypothetical protein [Paucimonas sp.]